MGTGTSRGPTKDPTVFDKFDKKNTEIDVATHRLRELPAIGRFTLLQTLVLRDNVLSALPEEFVNLKLLKTLDLSLNRFQEIPPVILALRHVEVLNMDGNMLSTVPADIKEVDTLRDVSFEYNKLETLPLALFLMPSVAKVKIRGNNLSALPKDLHVRMVYKEINGIFLTDNKFKRIPPEVLGQGCAAELFMDNNLLSEIPQEIRKLSGLKKIELSNNVISGIPAELFEIPKLTHLSIGHNQIDELPPAIGHAVMLQVLVIRDNRIKTLPDEMKNLKKLKVFDLAQNAVEDFPLVVTEMTSLVTLNMAANHLRFLPEELSKLIRLKRLGLGQNMLNDNVLQVLMPLTWVESVYLENNLIHCILPEVAEGLRELKHLSLDGNPIEDIPEVLMQKIGPRPKTANREEVVKPDVDMFGGKQTFTITPNTEKDEQITISNTFALEIPKEAVTDEMTFHVAYADEEDNRNTSLTLGEGEQQESEMIDVTPRSTSFGSLVSLVVKLDAFNDPSRDLVIMQKGEGESWKQLKTYQEGSLTKVKVRSLTGLVAVTKPHVDEMALSDKGGKLESTGVKDVSVSFPGGAVDEKESIFMEVDPMDAAVTDESDALCEARADVSVSPCVTIKGANGKKHLEFKKEVEVSLPMPPPIPGRKDSDTDIRVLKDERDNNIWRDVTDDLGPILRHARRASFGIRSFSGYVLARTDPLRRNRAPSVVSRMRRSPKGSRRPAAFKVKILLMQLSIAPQKMVVSVVPANRLRQKRREFVDANYHAYGIPYSGDIILKRGDTVAFDVENGFAFTNENRKCVFYPNRDNTTHIYIEAKEDVDFIQNRAIGFLKFYKKDGSLVAELPFKINKQTRRLSRVLTDLDTVIEEFEEEDPPDYDFFFSLLAGTLLAPYQHLKDFGLRLGLEPEEIARFRNLELRQQVYRMLLLWREKEEQKSDKAEMKSLVTALRDHRFEDHASALQTFRRSDPNTDIRGAMRHVACNIDPREMKMLARYLRLKENEIETIRHDHPNDCREQSYQMLLLWVRRAGSDATIRRLVEAMLGLPTLKELSDELVMKFGGMLSK